MKALVRQITTIVVAMGMASFSASAEEDPLPALLHDALAGALTDNPERVASVRSVLEMDQLEDPDSWSGVLDDVAVLEILAASTTQKEKAYLLHEHATELNDPVARERLIDLVNRVEDYRLSELVRKRRMNRALGTVNRTWQTAAEVLAGQPRALAVAGVDLYYAARGLKEPGVLDKKIGYLSHLQEVRGEATEEEIEQSREFVASLEEKRSRTLLKKWKRMVEEAEESGDWVRTKRLAVLGGRIWPEEAWFPERIKSIAQLETDDLESETQPLEISEEERAKAILLRRKLAARGGDGKIISDREGREKIGSAYAERRSRTLDYLLFGETQGAFFSHRNTRTVAAQGTDAPATLAFVQGVETVLRGVTLLFGNDLGLEKAIESYASVDRETPEALTDEDRRKWADLCAKAGDHKGALEILERAGIEDAERTKKYREDWAKAICKRCKDLPPGVDRYRAIDFVLKELADTSACKQARQLLAEAPAVDRPLVLAETKDLVTYEWQLAEAGFTLKREWWDSDSKNGEVARDRVYWDPEGFVWYQVQKDSPWRKVPQPPENLQRLNAVFESIEELAVARSLKEERRGKRRFPVEIEGELGSSAYITPKLVGYELSEKDDLLFE